MNSVTLSGELAGLYPPGVVAAEFRGCGDDAWLLPAEASLVGRAVPKRRQEFAAGRLCARRALAEFGISDFPVLTAADRQPIWPDSVVGSITHTAGFCAAVIALRRDIAAIGVDSEVVGDVNVEIWPRICVPAETAWLRSLPAAEHPAAAALIFSAKEAFYKCQYPLVREPLNFHDVRIEVEWGAAGGTYRTHAMRAIRIGTRTALPMAGRYLYHQGWVTSGMALAAGQ
jgi:4'-phosphopantetheinyl transferase EntD